MSCQFKGTRLQTGLSDMTKQMQRLLAAIAIACLWLAITTQIWKIFEVTTYRRLADAATSEMPYGAIEATLILLVLSSALRWRDIGLQRPFWPGLKLLWLPGLNTAVIVAIGLLGKHAFTASGALYAAINALAVGFSEELAFRGVLWGAARKQMPFWAAFAFVTGCFGAVHIINALITGSLAGAVTQVIAATMSGTCYLALRIRLRSIYPGVMLHMAWDLAIFILAGSATSANSGGVPSFVSALAFSVMLVLPSCLYGLWLIRSPKARGAWQYDSGH